MDFTDERKKRIVEITGRKLICENDLEFNLLKKSAIYFEKYQNLIFIHSKQSLYPSIDLEKILVNDLSKDRRFCMHEIDNKFWQDYYNSRKEFVYDIFPKSNLLVSKLSYNPKYPTLYKDQYGIYAYFIILPEDLEYLLGANLFDVKSWYNSNFKEFVDLYKTKTGDVQLKLLSELIRVD